MNWFRNECRRRHENLSLLACGALPEPEALELKAHLAECPACRQHLNELTSLLAPLTGWESSLAGVEPSPEIQQHWQRALTAASTSATLQTAQMNLVTKAWLELIWPARRTWTGLAAIWVALSIFNYSQIDHRETDVAKSTVPAGNVQMAFQEQQKLLVEIIGPPAPLIEPAEPPRRDWRPRSERPLRLLIA